MHVLYVVHGADQIFILPGMYFVGCQGSSNARSCWSGAVAECLVMVIFVMDKYNHPLYLHVRLFEKKPGYDYGSDPGSACTVHVVK